MPQMPCDLWLKPTMTPGTPSTGELYCQNKQGIVKNDQQGRGWTRLLTSTICSTMSKQGDVRSKQSMTQDMTKRLIGVCIVWQISPHAYCSCSPQGVHCIVGQSRDWWIEYKDRQRRVKTENPMILSLGMTPSEGYSVLWLRPPYYTLIAPYLTGDLGSAPPSSSYRGP